jgi:hypothetical protein
MDRQAVRILIALGLIALGVVALLANLNLLPFALNESVLLPAFFALVGLGFLVVFITSIQKNWWAVIPGMTLLGLAMLTGSALTQTAVSGGIFLGMIGLSFWIIFFTHRDFWWAIIPGGVLLTLWAVTLVGEMGDGFAAGGLLFIGLALTFLLVYFMATPGGRMQWALWPAGVLGLMGGLLMIGAQGAAKLVWPLALIFFGGLMVYRSLRPKGL